MFRLARRHADEIITHAREEAPNECCGILAGKGGDVLRLYRATNAERSPYRYSIEPRDLFRIYNETQSLGWDFLAIYHSHPQSEAFPSATDVALSRWDGPKGLVELWPNVCYLIVSLAGPAAPVIRAFRLTEGGIGEEPLEITD